MACTAVSLCMATRVQQQKDNKIEVIGSVSVTSDYYLVKMLQKEE